MQIIQFVETPYTSAEVEHTLTPLVKQWFTTKFPSFSLPQLFGVRRIHQRENILVSAPTGATKTLTAFLAVLNELVDCSQKGVLQNKVYCVYVSPLKALNQDIKVNLVEPLAKIEQLAEKSLGIRVGVRTGDTTASEKQKMLQHPPHILITTPESLAIMLSSEKFSAHLSNVDWCIIDEIHALAENKRGVHLSLTLERLQHKSPAMCRVGLSATVAPLDEVAKFLVGTQRNCHIIDVPYAKQLDIKVLSPVPDLIETDHYHAHTKMYELIDELIQQHKTTLVFTNTRSATERVVDHLKHKFPGRYSGNIGAHHGSLGKELRHSIEQQLRDGKLKCVVSSTSLELGLDIGFIDLVICLGSPKSVARFLQRAGRSGHKLHETVKARIIVMDRDDLVECAVLVKAAREKNIDKLHIPTQCLDVLSQQIIGMSLEQVWDEGELYNLIKQSYCYSNLTKPQYHEILSFLAGEFAELEARHVYARIWRKEGKLGKRGKLSRVLYMTNVGTIPDETFITVKVGTQIVGTLDEQFLERLKPGDVFVLGGDTYQFKYSKGTVAQVNATSNRPPTVPRWASEMLPLSFDLAMQIGLFRRLVSEKILAGRTKKEILHFLHEYLTVDDNAANAIYTYFKEQHDFCNNTPTDKNLLIEQYTDEDDTKIIFHTLYGRRVNDCLSRAIAYAIAKTMHKDVELGINDNGFFIKSITTSEAVKTLKMLKPDKLADIMRLAIENAEVFKRRFRHCATRSFMILRNYMGRQKHVGRQQVSSQILMSAIRAMNPDFAILQEARRECLEDLMDIEHCKKILTRIANQEICITTQQTRIPSPFALTIALQGYLDVLKIEDKHEFLRRMHAMILAKISLDEGKRLSHKIVFSTKEEKVEEFDSHKFWQEQEEQHTKEKDEKQEHLKEIAWNLNHVPVSAKRELIKIIDGERKLRKDFLTGVTQYEQEIKKNWPKELQDVLWKAVKEAEWE